MANGHPVKTRDRILLKSLSLFNEQGERLVTTNHIAAALNMSPGNLYYHFANKEAIIFELFGQYVRLMQEQLTLPDDRPISQPDKIALFEAVLSLLWQYRFLHRDMTHLLSENDSLRDSYRLFAHGVQQGLRRVYQRLSESGLFEASDEDVDALIINIWIVATSWSNFLASTGFFGSDGTLTEDLMRRGIYQVICLEAPYLRGEAALGLGDLKASYSNGLRG